MQLLSIAALRAGAVGAPGGGSAPAFPWPINLQATPLQQAFVRGCYNSGASSNDRRAPRRLAPGPSLQSQPALYAAPLAVMPRNQTKKADLSLWKSVLSALCNADGTVK
jgi:hypothetical protein